VLDCKRTYAIVIKKVLFICIVLFLVAHQILFLYGLQNGAADQFIKVWKSFGIIQTDYSIFLFKNFIWFWALPVVCLGAMTLSLLHSKKWLSICVILLTLVFDVALYWSAYAPELLVKL